MLGVGSGAIGALIRTVALVLVRTVSPVLDTLESLGLSCPQAVINRGKTLEIF